MVRVRAVFVLLLAAASLLLLLNASEGARHHHHHHRHHHHKKATARCCNCQTKAMGAAVRTVVGDGRTWECRAPDGRVLDKGFNEEQCRDYCDPDFTQIPGCACVNTATEEFRCSGGTFLVQVVDDANTDQLAAQCEAHYQGTCPRSFAQEDDGKDSFAGLIKMNQVITCVGATGYTNIYLRNLESMSSCSVIAVLNTATKAAAIYHYPGNGLGQQDATAILAVKAKITALITDVRGQSEDAKVAVTVVPGTSPISGDASRLKTFIETLFIQDRGDTYTVGTMADFGLGQVHITADDVEFVQLDQNNPRGDLTESTFTVRDYSAMDATDLSTVKPNLPTGCTYSA